MKIGDVVTVIAELSPEYYGRKNIPADVIGPDEFPSNILGMAYEDNGVRVLRRTLLKQPMRCLLLGKTTLQVGTIMETGPMYGMDGPEWQENPNYLSQAKYIPVYMVQPLTEMRHTGKPNVRGVYRYTPVPTQRYRKPFAALLSDVMETNNV